MAKKKADSDPLDVLRKIHAGAAKALGKAASHTPKVPIAAEGVKNGVYRIAGLVLRVRNGAVHLIEKHADHHAADTIVDVPKRA